MIKSDDDNLMLVDSIESVDQLNSEFYGRFPYPWRAVKFDYVQDPYFQTDMLNQEIGGWQHDLVPRQPKIWIAGCGTNQAIFTALRFPMANVLGSDISEASLEASAAAAKAFGLSHLKLKRESINQITYQEEFDYIICTGVVHHNADPQATLKKIAAALKPGGILELMVYNRFHWTVPAAFQKALRILCDGQVDFEKELTIAKEIVNELPPETSIGIISNYRESSDAMLADELLQPVLHSYTVESLSEMAANSNLEIMLPCLNQFDQAEQKISWNMEFVNPALRPIYDALPDERRWQVTNLLLRERSPQLWFYLQRKDSGRERKSEKQVCNEFLETIFVKAETMQTGYLQKQDGSYRLLPNAIKFPAVPPDASVRKILAEVNGIDPMRQIFERLGIETTFHATNQARLLLTTAAFPYLRSMAGAATDREVMIRTGAAPSDNDRKERAEKKLRKFKSLKPMTVSLAETQVVKTSYLREGQTLPLVISPVAPAVDLADWAASNQTFVQNHLAHSGAILFRGFHVSVAAEFERFAQTLCRDLLDDNGEHQRTSVSRHVYTPVSYPAEQQLLWHNENSFNQQWPTKIWFCCVKPAQTGGETPVVDSRKVYEGIATEIRERFVKRGVKYVRNYGVGPGLDWQAVFQTNDKREVEKHCHEADMQWEWRDDNVLRTSCVRPAILRHPQTGDISWFNQAQHWHLSCLDQATRESLHQLFPEEDMPRQCYYGDGSRIEDWEMAEILRTYGKLEMSFAWEPGDILMLDNLLVAHGRNRYQGERKLLVAMGDMLSYSDVQTAP